jgi:hypothetical protein
MSCDPSFRSIRVEKVAIRANIGLVKHFTSGQLTGGKVHCVRG